MRNDTIAKAAETTKNSTRFVASTAESDRAGDVLDQSGWQLERYMENPVVLWLHGRTPQAPIGKATNVETPGDKLIIDVAWDMADDFAAGVARKYEEGFLNACSVGYYPHARTLRSQLPQDNPLRTESGWGEYQTDLELLELSAVPVGCNASALVERELPDLGEDWAKLLDWLKAARDYEAALADIADAVRSSADADLRELLFELLSHDTELREKLQAVAWGSTEADEPQEEPSPLGWLVG